MRVIIVQSSSQNPERSALEQLLDEAEISCEAFPADEIPADVLEASDEPDGEDETEAPTDSDQLVLVLVLSEAVDSDDELGKAVMRCASSNVRIVGVWPAGASDNALPPKCIEDFGYTSSPWKPEEVSRAITGKTPEWRKPDGTPRPNPKTKRNKC